MSKAGRRWRATRSPSVPRTASRRRGDRTAKAKGTEQGKSGARDVGIDVPVPERGCDDHNCPFHGGLRLRGQTFDGLVVSARMQRTVVVEREYLRYIRKYERYEKRTRRMNVHAPPCLGVTVGSRVTIMECRPLSKTVAYVAIHNRGVGA